jgi:UDP-GlcNAc:undecaprenyl-phosphate GlcNAc-1-phosphate transferase
VGLFLSGIRITLFLDSPLVSLVLTVVWVVGITNAMNLLDNMDGLSAGVAAIVSFILFVVALEAGQTFVAAMLAVLFGTLVGFLVYNFNPASLFMGDAGSLFLGFLLAAMSVSTTYYQGGGAGRGRLSVVAPVVVLAIPIFDTLSVMAIRLKNGAPLMNGDKNHFSHRLVRLGMTVREAVLTIYILSLTIGLSAVLLPQVGALGESLVLLHTLGIMVVIILLECAAARRRRDG